MVSYLHLASVVVVQVLLDLARVKSAFGVEGMGKGQRRNWGAQKKKRKKLCAQYLGLHFGVWEVKLANHNSGWVRSGLMSTYLELGDLKIQPAKGYPVRLAKACG